MIRAETDTTWLLVTHPDHAALAGEFADAWGNTQFARPEPFAPIRHAVYHHDDGWLQRDANPSLTPAGKPEAFTRDLVGAYSAFEEIDLPAYLGVRAQATRAVAEVDPAAAVVVSMHTVNLLTEQADLESIQPEHREAHATFVAEQRAWQEETMRALNLSPESMTRGFEFLQCCDNLSLIACSGYDEPRALRHRQPDRHGDRHELQARPLGAGTWSITPWPFKEDEISFKLPRRRVNKADAQTPETFRAAFTAAAPEIVAITLRRA
ncbi:DUF3891 family protein [Synoicihabitans lomoniglobus]|uniref:DUF3891 family protein n=1 Tax=Synoicihabitans lomoniglobus TaxID=2909285 RepID=A0AAF0I5Q3_9BACT|nr:DUF3891 family protein [Opitutaceae bacterium LMO-M01]WED67155.1 DUF3891 family protein [Opitutaceae bacterium LMO-M01]